MSSPVRARLFGVPSLEHDGQSWALTFERRTQLLALLALKRGWAGRAEVAAMLWPDQDSKLAYTNLRKTLFRLPSLPWGRFVQTQGGALRFEGETDVSAFEAALHDERLDDALSLRRGELLSGFDDDANEAWTSWLAFERERLRGAWRGAALAWLDGDVPGPAAVALSAQLLDAEPFDEVALRTHLAWLQRTGQWSAARQVHARFMERLASELGLAPSAAMQALGAALLAQGAPLPGSSVPLAGRIGAASAEAEPRPIAAGQGSPTPIDAGFIGRGAELRRIASLLEQDDCRLVCLLGPGGVGKTRLARRALQEMSQGFSHGALFVPLEDAADSEAASEALARALGVRPDDHGDSLTSAIVVLQDRHLLLALDNLETVDGAAAVVHRLLHECASLKLLVTTRVRLALADEWVVTIEGLPCPDHEDLDRVDAFDAVRLFTRSARRVQPDFSTAAESAAIADICHRVGGLPLALELAAAWVRVLSCREIADELHAGTELLRAEDSVRAPRHASIEQVFEQSWQRLSEAERNALGRLSECRGGFDTAAARSVAGASLAVLAALIDKSLLHKDGARLRLHPLVQQLAAARLPAPLRDATAQAHAAHYLQMLARLRPEMESGSRSALDQVDVESANARAAWRWAATAGAAATSDQLAGRAQAALLAQAAQALLRHADHRGLRQAGLDVGQWAANSPAAERHPFLRAVLLALCAHLQYRLDRFDAAQRTAQAALDLAGDGDRFGARVQAMRVLAGCHLRMGRLPGAREHYEQALQLAQDGGDLRAASATLSNLALVEKRLGRYAEAVRLSLEALRQLRLLGSVADEALCLNNLGDLALIMGDLDRAESTLREGLALCQQHGIRGTQGLLMANLCMLAGRRGQLDDAIRHGRQALALLQQIGDRITGITMQQELALLELRQGRAGAAREALSASMREAIQIGHPLLQLYGLMVVSDLLVAVDPGAAAAVLDFGQAHPVADAPLRVEIAARRSALGGTPAVPAWPQDLDLGQAADLIAGEATTAIDRLRQRLRTEN